MPWTFWHQQLYKFELPTEPPLPQQQDKHQPQPSKTWSLKNLYWWRPQHLVQQRVVLLVVALGELLEPLEQVGLGLAAQQAGRARAPQELVEALACLAARPHS